MQKPYNYYTDVTMPCGEIILPGSEPCILEWEAYKAMLEEQEKERAKICFGR